MKIHLTDFPQSTFKWKTLITKINNFDLGNGKFASPDHYRVVKLLYKISKFSLTYGYKLSWMSISSITWIPEYVNGELASPNSFQVNLILNDKHPEMVDYIVFVDGRVNTVSFLPQNYWKYLTRELNREYGRENVSIYEMYPIDDKSFAISTSVGWFQLENGENNQFSLFEIDVTTSNDINTEESIENGNEELSTSNSDNRDEGSIDSDSQQTGTTSETSEPVVA